MRARPRASNSLARFSLHGITALPCLSNTKTAKCRSCEKHTGNRPVRLLQCYISLHSELPLRAL